MITFEAGSSDDSITGWDSHSSNYARQVAAGKQFWPRLGKLIALMKATPSPIVIGKSLFETQDRSIWLVTPIDSSWPAERQESQLRDHNWVFLRTIAMHETYPGHHLQPVHAKRQPSAISRTQASVNAPACPETPPPSGAGGVPESLGAN